ncbi:hypothetical protein D0Y65_010731 [Glycine soja]|uniref:Uncharacterized protein n=1 Tax=Glycine soja TaxID=3848 RepID=A0A445L4R5_GLYSO|nr:hypothetical protein D0Y65_010731 [Glycine soja]
MNTESSTSQFPVSQLNFSRQIKGNETEIIISRYEDHFMVIATQIGTMGTIMYASSNPNHQVAAIEIGQFDFALSFLLIRPLIWCLGSELLITFSLSNILSIPFTFFQVFATLESRDVIGIHVHWLVHLIFQSLCPQVHVVSGKKSGRKEEGVSINPTFNVSVIFGKRDEPMLVACARQLIEHMSLSGSSRPLVLSLGLKDHSVETLKGIVSAVMDNSMW